MARPGARARVRLNVDYHILPAADRRPERALAWHQIGDRCDTVRDLALELVTLKALEVEDADALMLRLDGYALAPETELAVLRDGDAIHVSATRNHEHGGPWPLSPAAAEFARAAGDPRATLEERERERGVVEPTPLAPSGVARSSPALDRVAPNATPTPTPAETPRRRPLDGPSSRAARPDDRFDRSSTEPRSRSARRKALKRARKRRARFGEGDGDVAKTPSGARPGSGSRGGEEKELESERPTPKRRRPTSTRDVYDQVGRSGKAPERPSALGLGPAAFSYTTSDAADEKVLV